MDIIGYFLTGISGLLIGAIVPLVSMYPKIVRIETKMEAIEKDIKNLYNLYNLRNTEV